MKYFKFTWLDKKISYSEGTSVSDAFRRLGYGGGAINALDVYNEISQEEYETATT